MTAQKEFDLVLQWPDDEAESLADASFAKDPLIDTNQVPPSLLSATDIIAYVRKTAMLSPFRASKSTLKHASYEARIGDAAYIYGDDAGPKKISINSDGFLRIPANEIVFVEPEVTFRLPRYIAARFNLTIKHVHRGLLLGTGPLVDPGFRGKLLIPLHNLTSRDYYISKDDGFIWIEFTRTTYDQKRPEPYGDFPKEKSNMDSRKWLHKAAYCEFTKQEVPIRSSIKAAISEVDERSRKAENTANTLKKFGYIGGISLFVSFLVILLAEIYTNRIFMQTAYERFDSAQSAQERQGAPLAHVIDGLVADLERFRIALSEVSPAWFHQIETETNQLGMDKGGIPSDPPEE